jgi:peroxiredoxin family protein
MGDSLNLVLFSGTDDKLQAAAVLIAGAAAVGRRVHVFLQYWALAAFQADALDADHGLSGESGEAGRRLVAEAAAAGQPRWHERLRQAKALGEVDIRACSLSMDVLKLQESDLSDLVDGVEGVASFYLDAGDGPIVFI